MKRTLFISIQTLASILIWSGCMSDSPRVVAQKFMNAMKNSDFVTAKKYATNNSKELIDQIANMTYALPQAKEAFEKNKITIQEISIAKTKAIVSFYNDGDKKLESLILKKENGEWKVSLKHKNDLPKINREKVHSYQSK